MHLQWQLEGSEMISSGLPKGVSRKVALGSNMIGKKCNTEATHIR